MRKTGDRAAAAAAVAANIRNVCVRMCLSLNLETTALPPQPPVLDHYIIAATAARPLETVKNSCTAVSGTPCYDYTDDGGGGGGGGVMGKTRARCNDDIL